MRFRGSDRTSDPIRLDMVAMIDIVFQLMVYFIMTFKVTALEGDFSVNMPAASETPTTIVDPLEKTISVQLTRGADGGAGPIHVQYGADRQTFADEYRFLRLREYTKTLVLRGGDPAALSQYEVEFDVDRELPYEFTVRAVEAVSGEVAPDGRIATLIERIRFRDNRPR